MLTSQQLDPIDVNELKADPDVIRALSDFEVYADKTYPFIVMEYPSGALQRYDIYRMVCGLPAYNTLAPGRMLAIADHISRERDDSRRGNLRYVTMYQNAWNKCRLEGSCAKYHSVNPSDRSVTLRPTTEDGKRMYMAIRVWVSMLRDQLEKVKVRTDLPVASVFDDTACRGAHLLELKEYRHALEPFVEELLDLLSEGAPVYQVTENKLDKSTIPAHHYAARPVLQLLHASAKATLTASTCFNPDWLSALVVDCYNVSFQGEYAHTNFLKVPKARHTAQDTGGLESPDPAAIMNAFEAELSEEARRSQNTAAMVDEEALSHWRMYEARTNPDTGKKRIYVSLSAIPPARVLTLEEVEECGKETCVTSPHTVYQRGGKDKT
jgi:hypothetical protein